MYYYTPKTGRMSSNPGAPPSDKDDHTKKLDFKRYQLRNQDGGHTTV
jgi:hypothetical protein